jgi:hypothetical protein
VLAASSALAKASTVAVNAGGVYWTIQGTTTASGALYASPLPSAGSSYPLPAKPLASGLNIYQIAIDALNVYWADPYASGTPIMKVPAGGGYPPAPVVSGGNLAFPTGVAVDAVNVYVANELNILRVPLGGSTSTSIASASQAYVIGADSANLYWTDVGNGTVVEMPKSGTAVTLATGQSVGSFYGGSSLAVDSANVYWLNSDGSVRAVPKSAGPTPPSTILVSTGGAGGIAADGANVYFTNLGAGTVMRTAPTGGAAIPVATSQSPLGAIAVDSAAVYWTGAAGVMAVAK